jgi:tRNA nucleotidyltransferase (CCA-adding enzyme)
MPPNSIPATVVALTHEHTDFDALAASFAASRLYPPAVPVLPRQINRNLEAFLTVYRDALPFVRLEELPRRPIDHVIVVDTQSVQQIRGMHARTTAQIIDHHPLMREIPAGWSFSGEEVGAVTTLLVERMADAGVALSPIEATLLMLGIYEDTGGLSFETTTPRDVRAAAWLLERSASLLIVNKFLHHPLTEEQLRLYQQLTDNSHPFQFHGHSVIIAMASVSEPVEEISTLAHKLRDLYEPDGLFMLVDMGDHIQLVARSTSEAIDAGRIATALGGGGHSRAAAALIRNVALHPLYETLVNLLQSNVRPTATVEQIMSHGAPQTLTPQDTIANASERMQRYGFEGFPVIEGGRIVGMLTRREIDRAMHHGLDRHPVSRYMRAGEVFVTPHDSVETLRAVMTEHDWGQVPVLDPRDGALLGIVTRTDLIKQWKGEAPQAVESLGERMASSLPAPLLELLRRAGDIAGEMGYPLYAVGGFVRDVLLGEPNEDIDLVVEGDAISLAHALCNRLGGRVRSHRRFGTAKWVLPPELASPEAPTGSRPGEIPSSLDFVTARTEFYERPTALPTVERSSIKQDMHRRDFTINTLAVRLTPDHWGELLDTYGGRADLENGVIRVLHSLSFVEDPTRILRAARFEQRFGFRIESRTEQLIADALPLLERVSAERVRHELELIMTEQAPEDALIRLDELGVLRILHPELRCGAWFAGRARELRSALIAEHEAAAQRIVADPDASPRLHMALLTYHLTSSSLTEFMDRCRLRREYRRLLLGVGSLKPALERLDDDCLKSSEIVRLLDGSDAEQRLVLRLATDSWLVRQRLDQYSQRLEGIRPILDGDDLRAMGIKPGRIYRTILDRLRDARLDGQVGSRAEEEQLVRSIFAELSRDRT